MFRESSRDRLILVHSHCLWFSGICACVHTQPVKIRDLSCDVYNALPHHFTKLSNDYSFSADSEELPDRCFIPVYTFFVMWTLICLQNTPVKQSNDKVRHHYDTLYGIDPAFVHTAHVPGLNPAMLLGPQPGINPGINPGTCLCSHRRHSGNFPGPTCSVKGASVSQKSWTSCGPAETHQDWRWAMTKTQQNITNADGLAGHSWSAGWF